MTTAVLLPLYRRKLNRYEACSHMRMIGEVDAKRLVVAGRKKHRQVFLRSMPTAKRVHVEGHRTSGEGTDSLAAINRSQTQLYASSEIRPSPRADRKPP